MALEQEFVQYLQTIEITRQGIRKSIMHLRFTSDRLYRVDIIAAAIKRDAPSH